MIECISSLSANQKAHVLEELARRGIKTGKEYVRLSYREISSLANFLKNHYMSLDYNQVNDFLHQFNAAETNYLKQLQNKSDTSHLPDEIRLANKRTRLCVQRILDKVEEKETVEDVGTAWAKLKSVFA